MSDLSDLARWLSERANATEVRLATDLMRAGLLLETEIKKNASGRPGPNVITGDYRGSWVTQPVPGQLAVTVSSNRPQGPRLEFGFTGVDSLGRTYNQPPYPHVRPAIREKEEAVQEICKEGISISIREGL